MVNSTLLRRGFWIYSRRGDIFFPDGEHLNAPIIKPSLVQDGLFGPVGRFGLPSSILTHILQITIDTSITVIEYSNPS